MKRFIAALILSGLASFASADVTVVSFTTGGAGAASASTAYTGTNSFLDSTFFSLKDDVDSSKVLQFQLSGITAATTRTLTIPDASGTLATLSGQTFSGTQIFNLGGTVSIDTNLTIGSSGHRLSYRSAQVPDTALITTGSISNHWVFAEIADYDFNFAHALQTNPTLYGHSANQNTTQWWGLTHDATNGVLSTGLGALRVSSASGMILSTGSAPTVSACGTTPSAVAGSNTAGRLTTGSGGTLQSCTLTFVPALATAPSCVANNETVIILLRAVATTTTLVIDAAVAGTMESDVINYICIGGS